MGSRKSGFYMFSSVFQKYKVLYAVVMVITIVAAIVFSSPYFVKPLYKSTLIMFPSATNSVSRILVSTSVESKEDILGFGEDERVEHMLQVLSSSEIFDKLSKRYNLMKHYRINENSTNKYSRLYNVMNSNIQVKRTENRAIKVIVYDESPLLAAEMANYIGLVYDTIVFNMQRERALLGFKIAEKEYERAKIEIERLEDSVSKIKNNETVNGLTLSTVDKLEWERKQFVALKAKYDELRIDAFEFLPQKFVVSKAYPADSKTYPIRWLIVVGVLLSVLFFTTVIILFVDKK